MNSVEQHYRDNYNKLVGILSRRMQKADAEDIVQQTYCNTYSYIQLKGTEGLDLDRWVRVVMHNCLLTHIRKEKHRGTTLEEPFNIAEHSIKDIHNYMTHVEIMEQIRQHSDPTKAILGLVLLDNYPYGEVCDMMSMSPNQVWKIVHRFKLEMRERYVI